MSQRAKLEIRIGLGSCGIASGGEAVRAALEVAAREAGMEGVVKTVGCNGLCHREPMVEVANGKTTSVYGNLTAETARAVALDHLRPRNLVTRARWTLAKKADTAANLFDGTPYLGRQKRIVLENCGEIDPLNIDDYLAPDPALTSGPDLEIHESTRAVRRVPAVSSGTGSGFAGLN